MDELIGTFIRAHFTEELVQEIYKSFGVFGLFNYGDAFEAFDGILNTEESDDSGMLTDLFMVTLHKQLDFLLEQHTLKLNEDATLEHKNEILRGLYMIQDLTDYTPISLVLESDASIEEKVCRVIEDVTMYDETLVASLLESYRLSFIENLKTFVYQKEAEKQDGSSNTILATINKNLKVYQKLFGMSEFVRVMLESEILPAQSFKDYLALVKDEVVTGNLEETALRVFWILLLSSDGTENPLVAFREYSQDILDSVDKVTKVDQMLLSYIGKFQELKKAMYA